jgi:hypothetical protein
MYWCKPCARLMMACILLAVTTGCKHNARSAAGPKQYFDIKGFFSADSAKLAKLNPVVVKTVTHNGSVETKSVKIANWGEEFGLFKEADINKPALKDAYYVVNENGQLIYRAKDPNQQVLEVLVKQIAGRVQWILIFTKTPQNLLYKTTTKLTYYPDSLYKIEMDQHVKLLGKNHYEINGVIMK